MKKRMYTYPAPKSHHHFVKLYQYTLGQLKRVKDYIGMPIKVVSVLPE